MTSFYNTPILIEAWWKRTHNVHNVHHMGPLTRYVKLRVAHAPGMPGTFSPQSRVSDPDMHHGTCVTHVPWCMPGSLTCGFLWSRWRGKRSRHSRRMRNPQFYVSGKRPIASVFQPGETSITELVWFSMCDVGIMYLVRQNPHNQTGLKS